MEKLFECKNDSNRRELWIIEFSFFVVLCAALFVEGIWRHEPWWFVLVSGIVFLCCAITLRNMIFGGIVVGVEDDNLEIHRKYWPHLKDKRIPLNDIAEVIVLNPREAENYIDYYGPLYNVQIRTKSGATYSLEEQLTSKQLKILQDFVEECCG